MTSDPEPPAPFEVLVHHADGACVLSVHGDLDLATSPHLGAAVTAAVADGATTTVVIDLTGVTFLSSTGMSVLIDAAAAVASPRRLAVVAAGTVTRRPLMLIGLDEQLSIHPTRTAALAAVL